MSQELQIFLTSIVGLFVTPLLAAVHWIFSLAYLASVAVFCVYGIKLIWQVF